MPLYQQEAGTSSEAVPHLRASGSIFTTVLVGQLFADHVHSIILQSSGLVTSVQCVRQWVSFKIWSSFKGDREPLTESDNKVRARSEEKWRWSFRSGLPDLFLTWQSRGVPLPSEIAVLLEKASIVTFGFSKGGWKVPKYKEPLGSSVTLSVVPYVLSVPKLTKICVPPQG